MEYCHIWQRNVFPEYWYPHRQQNLAESHSLPGCATSALNYMTSHTFFLCPMCTELPSLAASPHPHHKLHGVNIIYNISSHGSWLRLTARSDAAPPVLCILPGAGPRHRTWSVPGLSPLPTCRITGPLGPARPIYISDEDKASMKGFYWPFILPIFSVYPISILPKRVPIDES